MVLLVSFLVVAGIFVVTPGPDVALVTKNAVQLGRRAALQTTVGIMSGVLSWAGVASIGLVALLEADPFTLTVLRLIGAAYLGYLGTHALLALRSRPESILGQPGHGLRITGLRSPYLQGFLNDALNPKVALLFTALIPQFVSPGPSSTVEFLELSGIFAVMGLCALAGYSLLGSASNGLLGRTRTREAFDALTGCLLVAFGIAAAVGAV